VAVYGQYVLCVGTSPLVTGGLFALSFDIVGGFSEEGVYDTSGFAMYVDTEWPYAYIGDGTPGLVVADLTNIAAPAYVGTTPLISSARDVAINGSTACVISYEAGVEVFDAATPSSLLHLERLGIANATMFIFVDGDYLFTCEASAGYPAVKALDINDPANIYIAGEYLSTHGQPEFMDYSGGRIILGTGNKSFEYINASDPMNMTMIESQTYVDDLYTVSLYNDYMYLIVDNGSGYELHIYEQDGFNPMTYIDFYDLPFTGSPGLITCHGDYMFIPSGSDVYIYSLAFPEAPALIGKYSTFSKVFEAKVQGDFMYLTATNRLEIADFSDPLHPDYIGSVQLITNPVPYALVDVELDGQIAYTGGMTYDSYICNVWPPDNPTLISELPQNVRIPTAIFKLKDGYLFRGCFGIGIRVHDLY
ncbi:MAG: hypothetical protein NTY09_02275, partial [bacterium]|nr:hypothetical protein [bacterium]